MRLFKPESVISRDAPGLTYIVQLMIKTKKTILYFILREWCFIGTRLYFKKVESKYLETFPRDKPVIFVGNHCNTFIDPILIAVNTHSYPAYLATAAAFKNAALAQFLYAIRMLPVYRQRDGGDTIKRNEEIFDISIQQLEANMQFVIFPEGSHTPIRRLRDFKKGFARIGFDALTRNEGALDVLIVPVGVEYRQYRKMHQEVLQTFGKAIPLKNYWESYQKDNALTLVQLKNDVYKELKELMIHIPTEEHYEAVESLRNFTRPWLYDFLGLKNPNLYDKLVAEQQMIAAQTAFETEKPEEMESFARKITDYQKALDKQNFRNHLVQNPPVKLRMAFQCLLMIFFLPVYLFGVITSYIPYKLPVVISKKLFKDTMYYGAANYAGGLLFFTIFWIMETLLVQMIFHNGWVTLGFALLMPVASFFSFRYWIALKKLWHGWRYIVFSKTKPDQAKSLKEQHESIIKETEQMMKAFGA